mgnify:CR=1 FL=1
MLYCRQSVYFCLTVYFSEYLLSLCLSVRAVCSSFTFHKICHGYNSGFVPVCCGGIVTGHMTAPTRMTGACCCTSSHCACPCKQGINLLKNYISYQLVDKHFKFYIICTEVLGTIARGRLAPDRATSLLYIFTASFE